MMKNREYQVLLHCCMAIVAGSLMGCGGSSETAEAPVPPRWDAPAGHVPTLPTQPSANPFWNFDTGDVADDGSEDVGDDASTDGDADVHPATPKKNVETGAAAVCDWLVPCAEGYSCASGECVADPAASVPPDATADTAATEATAPAPTTLPPAALGGACTQDTTHCSEDFVCKPCVAGLVCNAKKVCETPAKKDAGDFCDGQNVCGSGLDCVVVKSPTSPGTESRCAKYLSTGIGEFCNPDVGIVCAANQSLACVPNPEWAGAYKSNPAAYGWCRKFAVIGEACHHAPPPCALANQRDCPKFLSCSPGLFCTSEFTGAEGTCIDSCAQEAYALAPVGQRTVPLVIELYEKAGFQGHRAVVATADGITRDWTKFISTCLNPRTPGTNYVWCRDPEYDATDTKSGAASCVSPVTLQNQTTKKDERWCRRTIPAVLPEYIDKKARSIRVWAGPNYVTGDVARFYDNVFGYGDPVVHDDDPLLGDQAPLFSMGPGSCADITKPANCPAIILHQQKSLKEKIRAVTIARGTYIDYCSTPIAPELAWTKPIWAVITATSGGRRTHIIDDTTDLHTYMMTTSGGKNLDLSVERGPDIGGSPATVIFYEQANWNGKSRAFPVGVSATDADTGPIRSLKILSPPSTIP